ncbi:hypothetical protein [Actinoplanes sp. RD1]|uniref:hypothetical protein n=1 Tax=Actinoplanes sp. RD1 TaxID=3064538 RepID=UPI00274075C0|nr:hypothetical protein [Actinoplanes sp. RD1]
MRVTMATDAGHPGRANEDFAGAVPAGLVLVDGAGGIAGAGELCHHGVAWYATRLGGALLGALADDRGLPGVLADGIARVTAEHRDTCDVTHPSSPYAAVAMLRRTGGSVEHLVLGDAVALVGRAGREPLVGRAGGEPLVVHDAREVVIARGFEERLRGVPEDSKERRRLLRELRAYRNAPGGYWVAKDDPRAAEEAISGSSPAGEVTVAALLSNGASRIVDTFGLTGWGGLLELLEAEGPAEVIRRVREAESRAGVATDDATVVCLRAGTEAR